MTYMRILLWVVIMGLAPVATVQADESVDLDALYEQIDDAISRSPQYVAERERQIAACRDSFLRERYESKSLELSLLGAERLFELYKPYRNDSAFYYIELCISLADSLQRPDLTERYRSMLAYQCSTSDRYTESLELLRHLNNSALDKIGLVDYYNAWMHVCGELGSYTQRKEIRQKYFDLQNHYRDSVLMVVEDGSEKWYHLKMDILSARRLYQDALLLSDQWLQKVTDNTHESAYAAFYRSMVYANLKNHDMTCYWLGKSALDDIRCAVMNQASLLFLAERLADDGDFSRAHRYVEFAKECNLTYSSRLRTYQVNSILNVIEKSSQATQSRTNVLLIIASIVIVLLLAALFYCLLNLRKLRLAQSR